MKIAVISLFLSLIAKNNCAVQCSPCAPLGFDVIQFEFDTSRAIGQTLVIAIQSDSLKDTLSHSQQDLAASDYRIWLSGTKLPDYYRIVNESLDVDVRITDMDVRIDNSCDFMERCHCDEIEGVDLNIDGLHYASQELPAIKEL